MFLSICYVALQHVLQLIVLRCRSRDVNALEIVVLRHEVAVLRRQTARPRLTTADRVFLAATSRVLPRSFWTLFLVKPASHRRVGRSRGALDLSSPCRPKADPPRDSAADPADRARESAMRLSAHRRKTERNRCRRIGDHRPERAPRGTSGSGWWPIGAIVASIPAVASEEPHRRRFLHRRHGLAATVVRLVLSKWPRGACTSPAAAPIPTARGSRSRHVRSRGRSPNARSRFAC